jgi:Mycothiol maleylpyruvate isomerase N-terminal domain
VPAVKQRAADALTEQSRAVVEWLRQVSTADFGRPSVLPGWDVRALTSHLVFFHRGLLGVLDTPTHQPPVPIDQYVARYQPNAVGIAQTAIDNAGTIGAGRAAV